MPQRPNPQDLRNLANWPTPLIEYMLLELGNLHEENRGLKKQIRQRDVELFNCREVNRALRNTNNVQVHQLRSRHERINFYLHCLRRLRLRIARYEGFVLDTPSPSDRSSMPTVRNIPEELRQIFNSDGETTDWDSEDSFYDL